MKIKNIKQEKGITLIALVITIIVLLILAGVAISMLSGENGILTRASEAKEQTENKSEEEQVKLAATEAMMTTTDYTVKYKELTEALNGQLGTGTYTISPTEDAEEWEIVVAKTKNHYSVTGSGTTKHLTWWYTGENKDKITNGKQELKLGDKIEYDPTAGLTADANGLYKKYESKSTKNGISDKEFRLTNNEKQKLEWRVLGTDDDGNVLIMPTECIKDENGSVQYLGLKGKLGVQYGVDEIDNIAAIYGYGTGAQSARGVKEEDIAKIVKPDNAYYGKKVTYRLNEQGKVEEKYASSTEYTTTDRTNFTYLDKNIWKTLEKGQSVTFMSTYNIYMPEEDHVLWDLLSINTVDFWISTLYVETLYGCVSYDMDMFYTGTMTNPMRVYYSDGRSDDYYAGIRPAVSLEPTVAFEVNEAGGWTIITNS